MEGQAEDQTIYFDLIERGMQLLNASGTQMDDDPLQAHQELNDILDRADQAIAEVGAPLERIPRANRTSKASTKAAAMAISDSKLVSVCCSILKGKAEEIDANLDSFRPGVFADNIVSLMEGSTLFECSGILDWSMLADSTAKCFRTVPSFVPMLGALPENLQPVIRERKIRAAAVPAAETRRPINVTSENTKADAEEGIDEIVLVMWKQLQREYKRNNSKPVCYFRFLLDPRSFGASVENMFYMSFLVKENRVALDHDERGLPVLMPVHKEKASNNSESVAHNQQMITSLAPAEYREIIQLLNIREPMLKRRLPEVEPVAGPSSRN